MKNRWQHGSGVGGKGVKKPTKLIRREELERAYHLSLRRYSTGGVLVEGCWHFPESAGRAPAVIVCHPHPLHGGTMSNNVIFDICEALAQQSIAALRFNFRGVRGSGGAYGEGIDEQEDVRAALALVSSEARVERASVGLAGYSFGASVALPVAVQSDEVKVLVLVSPALSDAGWEQIEAYSRPVFVISGEHDFVISPAQVHQHIKGNNELKQCEVISGADHFWEGYEAEVVERVVEFLVTCFKSI